MESQSSGESREIQLSTVPREITAGNHVITTDPERAANLRLERGQYRVQFRMPYDGTGAYVRELARAITVEDEDKRVYFYKVNVKPLDEKYEDEKLARVTLVFHVIDNPLPLLPIAWAAVAAIGSIGSWFVIDKVESFTSEGLIGPLVIMTAALGSLFLIFKSVQK